MRVFHGWALCALLSLVVVLAAGCSLGGDDDDNGGDAAAETGEADAGGGQSGGNLLAEVQDRGTLRCGVRTLKWKVSAMAISGSPP